MAVLLGRAGHGVCFGALGLGGTQGPLDLRAEVDLLEEGGGEKYLCLASGSLWGVRCRVVSWLWGPGAPASHWVVYVCPPHLPMAPSRAALGGANFSALSNGGLNCCCCKGYKNRVIKFCGLIIE